MENGSCIEKLAIRGIWNKNITQTYSFCQSPFQPCHSTLNLGKIKGFIVYSLNRYSGSIYPSPFSNKIISHTSTRNLTCGNESNHKFKVGLFESERKITCNLYYSTFKSHFTLLDKNLADIQIEIKYLEYLTD